MRPKPARPGRRRPRAGRTGGESRRQGGRCGHGGRRRQAASLAGLFRRIWACGNAGVRVPIKLLRETATKEVQVLSADRSDFLKKTAPALKQIGVRPLQVCGAGPVDARSLLRRSDRVAGFVASRMASTRRSSVCLAVPGRQSHALALRSRGNELRVRRKHGIDPRAGVPHSWTRDTGRGAERFGRAPD